MLRRARVQKSQKERWFKIVLPALLLLHSPTMYLLFGAKRFERLAWANLPINIISGGRDEPFWICIIRRRKKLRVLSGGTLVHRSDDGLETSRDKWLLYLHVCTKQSSYIKYLLYITCLVSIFRQWQIWIHSPNGTFSMRYGVAVFPDQVEIISFSAFLQLGAYTRDNINDNRILSRHAVLILAALLNHNDSHWSFSYGFEWALWCSSLSYSNIINRTRGYK